MKIEFPITLAEINEALKPVLAERAKIAGMPIGNLYAGPYAWHCSFPGLSNGPIPPSTIAVIVTLDTEAPSEKTGEL